MLIRKAFYLEISIPKFMGSNFVVTESRTKFWPQGNKQKVLPEYLSFLNCIWLHRFHQCQLHKIQPTSQNINGCIYNNQIYGNTAL